MKIINIIINALAIVMLLFDGALALNNIEGQYTKKKDKEVFGYLDITEQSNSKIKFKVVSLE